MKKIPLYTLLVLLFFSCKEEYFDGELKGLHTLVLNGNELIQTEKYYGDDFGGFHINELFTTSNGNIYFRAAKYIDREKENRIRVVGEMDINGTILWSFELENFQVYGFVGDDHNNIYVYGSTEDGGNDKACIGKIENQSVKIIYVDYIPPEGGVICNNFTSMKHESNGTFWWVGEIHDEQNYGVIGMMEITKDNVESEYLEKDNWYYYGIYFVEKTGFDSYSITYPVLLKPSQLGVRKVVFSFGETAHYNYWNSLSIITDNTSNTNLESLSPPGVRNNIAVKNGNDLVVVGYGDNAEGKTYTNNNNKIQRAIVACIDYQTGAIKWKRTIPESNPEIAGTMAHQILLHNNKYYVIGMYDYHVYKNRMFGYGFVQTVSLDGELLDCYLFGKDFEFGGFSSATIVGNKLLMAGMGGQKFFNNNTYNDLFVPYHGHKGWFVSCNIDDF